MRLFVWLFLLFLVSCSTNNYDSQIKVMDSEKSMNLISEKIDNQIDWKDVELIDLNGNHFTINKYKNKITLVSIMAMWCPQNIIQQKDLLKLRETYPDIAIISIDIDETETDENLREYVLTYGYDWTFAMDPNHKIKDLLKDRYGNFAVNPKATPIIIIDRLGDEFLLEKGINDYYKLLEEIENHNQLI